MERRSVLEIFVLLVCLNWASGLTVTTPVGDIEGFVDSINVHGRQENVRKFLGIPYAEPPTGNRRFAKPAPKGRFSVPLQALAYGPSCYQISPTVNTTSEDCLLLNIYSPERSNGSETFPVMIWIHGGGFVGGSSVSYPGDYLSCAGQVILVTINYRLAELGFLSMMDSVIPGNLGLWDQQLAIKWVHDNIGAFGGDTNRVTIFGQSAGSASVVFQTLYPGNLGLFQRAIAESGSVTSPWALQLPPMASQAAAAFAQALGCSGQTSTETLRCLRTKSAAEINAIMNGPNEIPKAWRPVVDNDFVLDLPEKILDGRSTSTAAKNMFNSVDLIIGVNNFDGVIGASNWARLLNTTDVVNLKVTQPEFDDILLPFVVQAYYKTKLPDVVNDVIRSEYTDWSDPNDDTKRLTKLADISTDTGYRVPTIDVADGHQRFSRKSTYVYEFSVSRLPTHAAIVPKAIDGPGVANHLDELSYLFRRGDPANIREAAKFANITHLNVRQMATAARVSTALITMWTNFAKTGDPNKPVDATSITNAVWPQYGAEENYLEISPSMTSQSVRQRLAPMAVDLFENVVPALMNATRCQPCQTSGPSGPGIIIG